MRAHRPAAALIALGMAACAQGSLSPPASSPAAAREEERDHAIYNAILDAGGFGREAPDQRFMVTDSTFGIPSASLDADPAVVAEQFGARFGGRVGAALVDLRARNQRRFAVRRALLRSPAAGGVTSLAALMNVSATQRDELWSRFAAEHPGSGGPVAFTRPGFSPNGRFALVYVVDFGGGWGRVGYVLLGRRHGRWTVIDSIILMQS